MELYSGRVEPSWIDYNGHMNVAYYHLASIGHRPLLRRIGLGRNTSREKGPRFALEDHIAP
jgi:acyl-CoA thioester hydrolase